MNWGQLKSFLSSLVPWNDESSSLTQASIASLNRIETLFCVRNPERVRNYFTHEPDMISVIQEAYKLIQIEFAGSEVNMEITDDPEEDMTTLLVSVPTNAPVAQALAQMNDIEQRLWGTFGKRITSEFCIALDFK